MSLDRVTYDAGVRLRGTPLSFDATRRRELCVITGLRERVPVGHRRIVASSQLAVLLERVGCPGSVLPLPFDRWVGVGGRELQLLPLAPLWGRAAAMVLVDHERVLVLGRLASGGLVVPVVDHLVVEAPALGHRGASLEQVAGSIGSFVEQAHRDGVEVDVWVEGLEAGTLVWEALEAVGVPVAPTGVLARLLGDARRRSGTALSVMSSRPRASRRTAWIDGGLGVWGRYAAARRAQDATFRLRHLATMHDLEAAARNSGARQVTIIGEPPGGDADALPPLSEVRIRWLVPTRQLSLRAGTVLSP